MVTFRVDKENNILFVTILGVTPKEKMGELIAEFSTKCSELREYFTIINDLSLYKSHSEHDFELMCKLTQMLLEKFSIARIIRITGENTQNMKKLLLLDKTLGLKNIYYAANKKAALESIYKFTH